MPSYKGVATGKYEITLTLTPEEAADAEVNGLSISRGMYQDKEQIKVKLKTKYPLNPLNCVDRYKNPFVDDKGTKEIPRGSKVAVFYTTKPYTMMGKSGVSNYLHGIQVIEENNALVFDDYEEPDSFNDEADDSEY